MTSESEATSNIEQTTQSEHELPSVSSRLQAVDVTPEILQDVKTAVATVPVEEIERRLLQEPQYECPVFHTFGPGIYVRELHVGAGCFLLGHEQVNDQLNVFLKGAVAVFDSSGEDTELVAPMMFTGRAGRKVGIVTEDMVWLNVFPTDATDLEELENILFNKSEIWGELMEMSDPREHGYDKLLEELNITREQMDDETYMEEDMMGLPYGTYKCGVHRSRIHGKGLMTTARIEKGECIGPMLLGENRTPFARYVNHSDIPNAQPARVGDDIYLFALADLFGNQGGLLGEEILVDYREVINT